ncbi:uncharacterized protein LOC141952858 [Strix uralensis]|uniref:uncharacterized protein LOC141952858 n=1 Tax=Strix uralensis TaxID=36305 RepID=UPI003DA617B6
MRGSWLHPPARADSAPPPAFNNGLGRYSYRGQRLLLVWGGAGEGAGASRGSSREKGSGAARAVAWRLPGKAATGGPHGAAGPGAEAAPRRGRAASALPGAALWCAGLCSAGLVRAERHPHILLGEGLELQKKKGGEKEKEGCEVVNFPGSAESESCGQHPALCPSPFRSRLLLSASLSLTSLLDASVLPPLFSDPSGLFPIAGLPFFLHLSASVLSLSSSLSGYCFFLHHCLAACPFSLLLSVLHPLLNILPVELHTAARPVVPCCIPLPSSVSRYFSCCAPWLFSNPAAQPWFNLSSTCPDLCRFFSLSFPQPLQLVLYLRYRSRSSPQSISLSIHLLCSSLISFSPFPLSYSCT